MASRRGRRGLAEPIRGESPGEFPGRELSEADEQPDPTTAVRSLPSCRLGTGPEWCHPAAREREFRCEVEHRADFADEAVEDPPRGTAGEDVGDHRPVVLGAPMPVGARRRPSLPAEQEAVPNCTADAPSARAATMPRASAMPPVAMTGTRTASATCGTSAIVPTWVEMSSVRNMPRWPPASKPCAMTASLPRPRAIVPRPPKSPTTGPSRPSP